MNTFIQVNDGELTTVQGGNLGSNPPRPGTFRPAYPSSPRPLTVVPGGLDHPKGLDRED